jgi:Family of unknown function (DUF6151)
MISKSGLPIFDKIMLTKIPSSYDDQTKAPRFAAGLFCCAAFRHPERRRHSINRMNEPDETSALQVEYRGMDVTRMPVDLPLRCRCGHLRGIANALSPSAGFRFVCYCTDCQALARFLDRAEILDSAGGTDIFQMPPGRMQLTAGVNVLRCLRFGNSGVFRWYTDCCRTPIANTAGPRFPIIGVIYSFMDHAADGRSRNVVLGPPLCRIFERSATGPLPASAPPSPSFRVYGRRASMLLRWWVRGLARPNPFFDDGAGVPLFAPRIITPAERAAL